MVVTLSTRRAQLSRRPGVLRMVPASSWRRVHERVSLPHAMPSPAGTSMLACEAAAPAQVYECVSAKSKRYFPNVHALMGLACL